MPQVNQIGEFRFVSMSDRPPSPRRQTLYESRPGVGGYSLWTDAIRGDLFQVNTVVDARTFREAQALLRTYEAIQGTGPFPVRWSSEGAVVWVHIERVVGTARAMILGIGGLVQPGPARAIVQASWTLVPVN